MFWISVLVLLAIWSAVYNLWYSPYMMEKSVAERKEIKRIYGYKETKRLVIRSTAISIDEKNKLWYYGHVSYPIKILVVCESP